MPLELPDPRPEFTLLKGADPTRQCAQVYTRMRDAIVAVFPEKSDGWKYVGGFGDNARTTPPPKKAKEWVPALKGSHPFAQELASHYFALWSELESRDFVANGKTLHPHQRALFAWLTIGGICSGTRDALPAVLLRSPYGSGKSLVGGLAMDGFVDLLLTRLQTAKRSDAKLPRGIVVGLKRDLLVQNALGSETFAALRPPYRMQREHAKELYQHLATVLGVEFRRYFSEPHLSSSHWYDLCGCNADEDEEVPDFDTRLRDYLGARLEEFSQRGQSATILRLLRAVLEGGSVLVPDATNDVLELQAHPAPTDATTRFRGDMSYAMLPELGVRATHKHLLPDPAQYTKDLTPDAPPLLGVFTGTSVTRTAGSVGKHVQEILDHVRLVIADEAGKFSPAALRANTPRGKDAPLVIGLAAMSRADGAAGNWSYSPTLDTEQCIVRRITPPVSFAFIGSADKRHEQGSTEAWRQYEADLFADVESLRALGLPQPRETDGLLVVPPKYVRTYGRWLKEAYAKHEQQAQVFCYDVSLGTDRWRLLENTLRGPSSGVPRKVVVGPAFLSTGYSFPTLGCVDVLCKVRPQDLEQLLGRLFHRRNMQGVPNMRTYFRQQVFDVDAAMQLRKVATELGYPLPATGATWVPYMCAIDRTAKKADEECPELGEPAWVPDLPAAKEKQVRRAPAPKPPHPSPASAPSVEEEPESEDVDPVDLEGEDDDDDEPLKPLSHSAPTGPSAITVTVPRTHGSALKFSITVQANGGILDIDIEQTANTLGLGAYCSSLSLKYEDAYREGKRGEELVTAIGLKAAELLDKQAERKKKT